MAKKSAVKNPFSAAIRTSMKFLKQSTIFLAVTGLFFVLAEGLSSTTISLYEMLQGSPHPGANHYDEDLGWSSNIDTYIPNKYGPGKYLRTNTRGFRNDNETNNVPPPGKIRLICSGDSFTFGEGVANNLCWCHLLSRYNNRFDTVNLGQPGYGADQMYLRYLRDAADLEHSIHIFAFIGGDLDRMALKDNNNYGKPVLSIADGTLTVGNVPVPRVLPMISRALARADFRTVDFGKRVIARLFEDNTDEAEITERIGPIASMVFQNLNQLGMERDVLPVFVYLPVSSEIRNDRTSQWHEWVIETMNTLDLAFIDLTPALQALPAGVAATYFIPPWDPESGHYSVKGNEWVAAEIYKHLMQMPQFRALLSEVRN